MLPKVVLGKLELFDFAVISSNLARIDLDGNKVTPEHIPLWDVISENVHILKEKGWYVRSYDRDDLGGVFVLEKKPYGEAYNVFMSVGVPGESVENTGGHSDFMKTSTRIMFSILVSKESTSVNEG